MKFTLHPRSAQPWRPRPTRSVGPLVFGGACFVAALALCGLSLYLAYDAEAQRRRFDAAMQAMDRGRVTDQEIREASRLGEEIAIQQGRPAPGWTLVPVTYYSEEYRGRTQANGHPFDPDALTCAHRTLPLGTRVELRRGDRVVTVPVTDRGPYDRHPAGHPLAGRFRKEVDLSAAAFRVLSPDMTGGEGLLVHMRVLR
jgi:hypothetical protein